VRIRTRLKRAARRKRQRGWRKVAARPLFTCGACGKSYSNPLGHVCGNAGDFGKRRRARKRAEAAAARKAKRAAERERVNARVVAARQRERERAAQRVSATRRLERARADARVARAKAARPASRPRPSSHDWRNCRDHDCQRPACEAYREGVADGMDAAEEAQ
jgi:hypothetical protein